MGWLKRIMIGVAIVLSLAGGYLSVEMLFQHLHGKISSGLLQRACGTGQTGCDKVVNSRWSVIPPRPKARGVESVAGAVHGDMDRPAGSPRAIRLPVPVLGLLYFSFLAAWFICIGCPNESGRRWQFVPFVAVFAGNVCSVFYIYIMASVVKAWCAGCLTIHAINLLLLIIVIAICPRRSRAAMIQKHGTVPSALPPSSMAPPHPSVRLALVTIALAVSFWLIGGVTTLAMAFYSQAEGMKVVFDEVSKDPNLLVAMYSKRDKCDIDIRLDDPWRGERSDAPAVLVVFSDMTCPLCRTFETFLAEQVQPLFGDRLRVIFKHFPLSGDCNRFVKSWQSSLPCVTAYAAETARLRGGNDSFWKMSDEIHAQSEDFASLDYQATAKRLGIDPDQFAADMKGPFVGNRIAEDVELAHKLGVELTPTMFLNGRLVPRLAHHNLDFWKQMATTLARVRPVGVPPNMTSSATSPDCEDRVKQR